MIERREGPIAGRITKQVGVGLGSRAPVQGAHPEAARTGDAEVRPHRLPAMSVPNAHADIAFQAGQGQPARPITALRRSGRHCPVCRSPLERAPTSFVPAGQAGAQLLGIGVETIGEEQGGLFRFAFQEVSQLLRHFAAALGIACQPVTSARASVAASKASTTE